METETILKYIGTWNWQILAMLFLCASLVSYVIPTSTQSIVISVVFFLLFIVCEIRTLIRRKELITQNE